MPPPVHRPGFLPPAAVGLLALELLPLALLLWDGPASAAAVRGTLIVALVAAVVTAILALLAVAELARPRPTAGRWRWLALSALLLAPTLATVLPLLPRLASDPLNHGLWALVFVGIAAGQVAAFCLLRQAFDAVPPSRFQAAEIDCINPRQRLRHVLLPACAPALAVLAALTFLGSWSELLLFVALRDGLARFTLGDGLSLTAGHTGPDSPVTAVYLLASVPAFFLAMWTLHAHTRPPARSFARP